MKLRKQLALRLTALLLCVGLMVTFLPVGSFAQAEVLDNRGHAPLTVAIDENGEPESMVYAAKGNVFQDFFEKAHILYYAFDPSQMLVYNKDGAFQWIFGFNKLYDIFTAFANVYADTMRFVFEYEGEDWMIQLWKGSYAVALAAGGEVGFYNKPTTRKIGHFDAANDKDDLMGVSMTMYNNENYMFTRPFSKRWWTTGYQVSLIAGIQSRSKPRSNLTMDTRIQLKSAAMANLFAEQLRERGFRQVSSISSFKDVDTFTISGDTVRVVWRYLNESYY